VLEAEGISRAYGVRRALDGIVLRLAAGDCRLILGPNGAGKSTLLRVLAGLLKPQSGSVRIEGRALSSEEPAVRGRIGFVSHQTFLYDDLTLEENLVFAARLQGVADPRAAAARALDAADLADRAPDRPRDLSRGMQQRAAIARALVHAPPVLLLDEPFTGLDVASADRLRARLLAERAAGRALLIVSHQPAEVWEVATEIGVMEQGRWIFEGKRPADLAGFAASLGQVPRD
jgi:heme exporter protein A